MPTLPNTANSLALPRRFEGSNTMTDTLNLTSLQKAVTSFHRALDEFEKDTDNEFVRDSCIQRFEYCYDLSTKMIKRHLSNISENPSAINEMSFQQLIREGYTKGILKNSWDKWSEYRDDRNATSHGYDEERAKVVVASIVVFYEEVNFLLEQLQGFYEASV